MTVSVDEIASLLQRVAREEVKVSQPAGALTWEDVYAGNVTFLVDGWTVVVFNDCDEWDYVDNVITPDGRTGEFDDWPDEARSFGLTGDDYQAMERAFTGQRSTVPGHWFELCGCGHAWMHHDVEDLSEDPKPSCCVEGCACGPGNYGKAEA